MKKQLNYWKVSTIVLAVLLTGSLYVNYLNTAGSRLLPDEPEHPKARVSSGQKTVFSGTVMTGAQIGEMKNYCSDGLYLVADEGKYLVNQTSMLMLKFPEDPAGTRLSNDELIGKWIEINGKYPAQEYFCEALTCSCEDYILVETINILE